MLYVCIYDTRVWVGGGPGDGVPSTSQHITGSFFFFFQGEKHNLLPLKGNPLRVFLATRGAIEQHSYERGQCAGRHTVMYIHMREDVGD